MRKIITTILVSLAFLIISGVNAQIIDSNITQDDHTAREEAEGKKIWQKFQNKEIGCSDLLDDNFDALGEYFMGQMMGNSHSAMNQMMVNMMGEEGEKQAHVVMGKRLSGCDTTSTFPSQGTGFMPMMQMMIGGWSSPFWFNPTNNSMMNFGYGLGLFGWIFMILWWVLTITGIVALIKWLVPQSQGGSHKQDKSPLEALKERYVKGEIDKKEFEEKKKDIL